ncbi:rho GTPase-activating protein 30 isoform X2 [Varanus komodoensis]|uniref:rho GTPase-activating protein 30 isoform X2 n=1 Tax=Varanus komodoensis TaxID=61221 RepID=UPI001CF76F27|nr:rho GTPase-activating protein 30 isoform X2 [Varanus komodoensis]
MSLAMKARQKVKRKAAAKDRVFGCDLVEHLQLSGQDVPQVLKSCTEFVEHHGIVDGIYRLSGISSNIQKLRLEFDAERSPDLNKDVYLQDIHCVSSLCKAYFRELPNPLLTYQLYDKFADAVAIQMEEGRLEKIKEVLKELPSPHYRTLEFLMKHLVHMASHSAQTNMHVRNLAIVWAPNLLRSKDIELSGFNGTAAFMEVRIQSIVVEFILTHVEQIFRNAPLRVGSRESLRRSLLLVGPSVTYPEEKYSFSYNVPAVLNQGDGPPQIRPYHTIIELADSKRKGSIKAKKWKSIFNLGRSSNDSRRKSHKPEDKDDKEGKTRLRPAKSMDSLSSLPCASDDHTLLGRKKSQKQLTLDREGFDGPVSLDSSFLESDEYPDKAKVEDVHGESEGEATAKSEPTTPKVSRSSLVGVAPQGRSPKATHNRAEKCAGVHISGPFSVTVPFHITSNLSLSRLTRGQECPALSHFSGEKEAPETAGATDKPSSEQKEAEMRPVPAAALDKEGLAKDPAAEEETRISLEVQHTFSFLDCQDAWLGDSLDENQPCKGSDVGPESVDCSVGSLSLMDDDMGSGFMNELIGDGMQLEMFSRVQQLDYLSIEDCMNEHSEEDDDQYYLAMGFTEEEDTPKEADHEEVYLTAFDDLSPLATEFQELLQPDEAQAPQFPPPGNVVEEQPFSLAGWALPAHPTGSHSGEAGVQAQPSSPPGHDVGFVDSHTDPELASPSTEELGVSPHPGSASTELEMHAKGEAEPATGQPCLVQGEGVDATHGRDVPERAECLGQTACPAGVSESAHQRSLSLEHEERSSFDHEPQLHAPNASDVEQAGWSPWAPSAEADGPPQEGAGMSSQHMGCALPFQEAEQLHRGGVALLPQTEDGPSALEGPALPGALPSSLLGSSSETDQSEKALPPVSPAPHPEQAASSGAAPPDAPSPDSCIDPISMAAASPDSRPESLLQKPRHAPPTDQRDALRHGLCDGSVHMRLTSSSIKVQHVKSFPVVPPKPQFAKIPPALTPRAPAREASTPGASPPPAQDCRKKTENGLDKGSLHKPLRPVSLDAPWGPASVSASTDPLLAAPEPWAPSRNCCGDGGALLKQRNSMPVSLEHYGPDCESGRDAAQSPHISLLDGCSFWPQGGPRGRDGHLPVKFSLPERSSNMHSAGQDGRGEPSTPQLPPAALPEKGVGEAGGAAPQKQRWVSWRNGGSMSFDEAVALAKERHVAQAPVRRMQTYCYGDSEALPGPPGTERPPAQPKPALRLLGQRPLRPLSCLAVAEGPASGKPLAAQAPAETSPDGRRPPSQEEPSIPADPQPRSRTGLSRVGRCPAMTEESSHSSPQERR